MTRKDFYCEYYKRTNKIFSDKIIWSQKEREKAWQKRQIYISKLERKVFISIQYLILLLCWVPMCFDSKLWIVIPISISVSTLVYFVTDFSFIKMELLYSIYRKNDAYASMLHDIFIGNFAEFLEKLKSATKKKVTGYVFWSGGKFYGKYFAVCRSKNDKIVLMFKRNRVIVTVNENTTVIRAKLTKQEILDEIATIIN